MPFRYEMKKLFSRRAVELFVALGAVLSFLTNQHMIRCALGGYMAGMKDVYARYDGQIATDALLSQAYGEYLRYVADHPGDFTESGTDEETGETDYYVEDHYSYAAGLHSAYKYAILQYDTVEDQQRRAEELRRWLKTGQYDDGTALTQEQIDSYTQSLETPEEPNIILYTGGWSFVLASPGSGMIFLLLALALLGPLFSGERAARMEPIVLACPRRGRMAAAKLLAAGCCTLLLFLLSYGPTLLATALTYGLPDLSMRVSQVSQPTGPVSWNTGLSDAAYPLRLALLRLEAVHLAAAFSCAALAAFCSAALRRPLASLCAAAAGIAAQFALYSIMYPYGIVPELSNLSRVGPVEILPAVVLTYGGYLVETLGRTPHMLWAAAAGVASAAALMALAPACWLRPRII